MNIYESEDGNVIKYVHEDLSETTIKFNSTCEGRVVESNKVTVFISVSVGCNQGCKMCYLSVKKFPYKKLGVGDIFDNVCDALEDSKELLKDKYIKLSFMGMGDVATLDPVDFISLVRELTLYVNEDSGSLGLDGVDVGTSYPKTTTSEFITSLNLLNSYLYRNSVCKNPSRVYVKRPLSLGSSRTPLRLFYSLHPFTSKRKKLLPNSYDLGKTLFFFDNLNTNLIFHYTLIESVNNLDSDIASVLSEMRYGYYPYPELRLLRYNECEGTDLKAPSEENFQSVVSRLSDKQFKFKYQISTGSEIKAACGQFLMKEVV